MGQAEPKVKILTEKLQELGGVRWFFFPHVRVVFGSVLVFFFCFFFWGGGSYITHRKSYLKVFGLVNFW